MKSKIAFLFVLALMCTPLASCYEDKSTYPDSEVPSIIVDQEGEPEVFRLKQGETLNIDPKAKLSSGAATDFTYLWYMKQRSSQMQPEQMYFLESDCMGSDEVFEHVVTEAPTPSNQDYVIMLWIKDNVSEQEATFYWRMAVTTGYGEGLLIAYQDGKTAELGFIADPLFAQTQTGENRVMAGLIAANNDAAIKDRLDEVAFTRKGIYAISQGSIYEFDQSNYMLKNQGLDLFVGREEALRPQKLVYRSDGQLFMVEGSQLYSMPVSDYELRKFTIPYLGNYSATQAITVTGDYPMAGTFYDEVRGKFMYIPFSWSGETTTVTTFPQAGVFPGEGKPDPDNLPGMEAVWSRLALSRASYNLLRDKETGALYVYSVNDTGITATALTITGPDIGNAVGFEFHEEYSVMYYYTPTGLYSVYLRDEAPVGQLIFSPEGGEEITFLSVFQDVRRGLDGRSSGLIETHNRLLLVATYGSGKGSLHAIPTRGISGGIDLEGKKTFSGFGRITHVTGQE